MECYRPPEVLFEKEKPYPPREYVRVDYRGLEEFIRRVFEAVGVGGSYARIVAENLVLADLMGISSHGVQRIRRYINGIVAGSVKKEPDIRIVSDAGATVLLDGDNGLGQVVARKAMEIAIERAGKYGVGLVFVRRSHHYGIAGYYTLLAAEREMIGFTATNTRPLAAYTNTMAKYIGTNPISFSFPRACPPPILYDAATTTVPVGKIEVYAKTGKPIPSGWLLDLEKGEEITGDADKALQAIREGKAALLPLGGLGEERGGHKGAGLALIVELLALTAGAAWAIHVGNTTTPGGANVGHILAAINIKALTPIEEYYERVERLIAELKKLPKHPKSDNIWLPGEKAWLTMKTRKKIGIPIHLNIYRDLVKLSQELGIQPPAPLEAHTQ